MRFYNVEMKGRLVLPKLSSVPVHSPEDEGKIFYSCGALYYSDSTAQISISTTGGGAATGNAAFLDGQPASYYLCRDNQTGCNCADLLDGQPGSYYTCADNITGTYTFDATNVIGAIQIQNGGTEATTASGARSNLNVPGLCDNNTYYGCNTICGCQVHEGRTRFNGAGASVTIWGCENTNAPLMVYNSATTTCNYVTYFQNTGCGNGIYSTSPHGLGFYSIRSATSNNAIYIQSWATTGNGGIYVFERQTDRGIYAYACGSYAVGGNTAYCVTSSKHLKQLHDICLTKCVREKPLKVYKYYWDDANNRAYNQSIGPTAEDFNNTFNVDHSRDNDEYDGLWTVDGAALGIGIENIKEIDKLKSIVVKLYACIQKLEGME
jgi:hypothetical protein